jgi:hypothetical protein
MSFEARLCRNIIQEDFGIYTAVREDLQKLFFRICNSPLR